MNTSRSSNERRAWQPAFAGIQRSSSLLELEAWMPSEIGLISPMFEQLMRLIEAWRCVTGNKFAVELALREALNNAVVHGNAMDPNKLVEVRCRCERGKGVWLIVKDQGKGFDPGAVSDPLASDRLQAEHGRGIHLMKLMMDEVSFHCAGSEVRMHKGPTHRSRTELPKNHERVSSDATNSMECDAAAVGRE
jgi:anti-sigma regulatory factor (Ser/Thr protein kinase)